MPHYNLTILTSKTTNPSLIQKLKERYKVLLVDKKVNIEIGLKPKMGILLFLTKIKRMWKFQQIFYWLWIRVSTPHTSSS